ncbi:TonB-dependent siderophore receptor [Herbaspirillum sp. WKF16]|uniref:TonB-dependent siderophore receptor n=1 Tax=Herbaspirillum sp. WKF16 TaxID=3028312 RepID=UPI0023A9A271|nr:TonB-dependent siderophore receptor [Herbaspirillum sp. WKF16]WDZ97253.1 TonB-dependent siderophore receptor [Herbaspirillum sp. WKF16]
MSAPNQGRAMPGRLHRQFKAKRLARAIHLACASLPVALLAYSAVPACAAEPAGAAIRAYNIPAGSLSSVLSRFATESGILLSVDGNLTAGKTSPGLQGNYAIRDGFEKLLTGTGLTVTQSAAGYGLARSAAAAGEAGSLPQVAIVGQREAVAGYVARNTSTATKSDTPIRDIPQTVSVITHDSIRDQAMQSMADAMRYVPGIGMANGEGNRDSPIIRGNNASSGDFYIDGIRDDVEYYRDLYNTDRVEALTGPNAMIFGRGGSGGVINRVTKKADWSNSKELSVTYGSYNNRRVTADIDHAVNDDVAVRVAAMYENSDGYQKNFNLERLGINPTVSIKAGPDTLITLGYEHYQDDRVADRGIPSLRGRPYDTDVSTFFGDPRADRRPISLKTDSVNAIISHDFGAGVKLTNQTRFMAYDKFYQNYNAGAVNLTTGAVPVTAYNNHQWRRNLFNQTDLNFDLSTGDIKHRMLVGMELGQQNTDYFRTTGVFANGTTTGSVNLANPSANLPVNYVLGASASDRDATSNANIFGLYVQDQMELSKQFQIIGGVRFDRFSLDYHNRNRAVIAGGDLSSSDNLVSPRLGFVFKPVEAVSLYANYSVAYFPRGGDQLSSLSNVNQGLKPEKFTNYEVGAKWEIRPDLLGTVALYRLKRNNVAVTNPLTGIADQLTDGQKTDGVELGLSGYVSSQWSIKGGYAYQDSKLTATTSGTAQNGAVAAMVPKHTFSLWNRYDFTPQWGAALGIIHVADQFASTSNLVKLPSYTRYDGAVYFVLNKDTQIQLNIENITDKKYWTNANGDNNITPGAPRLVRLGLTTRF